MWTPSAWASILVIGLLFAGSLSSQELEHGTTPADIERGGQIFLASCSVCHGPDGDAIAGTDLSSGTFRRGATDAQLAAIIRSGIPGTAMPPNNVTEADAGRIVGYLRSLPAAKSASMTAGLHGDAANGKAIFEGKGGCRECHMAAGSGGFLGPDLSSVGVTRRAAELERALTDPSADIRTGNLTATVVKRDGSTIVGRLLNQDTYSLQLIDAKGNLISVQKDAVKSWDIPNTSPMPNYSPKLAPQEIADVVSYLRTLNAPPPANPFGRGGGGRAGVPGGRGGGGPAPGQRGGRAGGQP
jgi:putative heme-binding domain-containing protein